MSIRVWDYLQEYEEEREDILGCVEQVFRSGRLILGPQVEALEQEFARYCECAYGVGVGNATDGLFLALKALDIGPGDEVVTVANTAVPTVAAIQAAGATARFVDVSDETLLMNTSQLDEVITPRTKCILPVHLFGQCVDMGAVRRIAEGARIRVVEDCAQSHGATYRGCRAGRLGDMGVFSFYPTKPLGGYGDGGMLTTNDADLAKRLRRLRFYGMEGAYYSEEPGYNSRLDELQAAILRRKLVRLEGYIERRREIASRYQRALARTSLRLPVEVEGNRHVYYLYVVRHAKRDWLLEQLRAREILLNISYPWPIHLMRGFSHLGYKEGSLPVTERAAKEVFSLPLYPSLPDASIEAVCRALGELLGESVDL